MGPAPSRGLLTVHRIANGRIYGTMQDSNDVDFVKVFALVPRVTETARTRTHPIAATAGAAARSASVLP